MYWRDMVLARNGRQPVEQAERTLQQGSCLGQIIIMANRLLANVRELVDLLSEQNTKDCIAETCIPITLLTLSQSI